MIDAPAPGPVMVVTQTRFSGGPPPETGLANVAVFAIRPDGTLADMATSDASGNATLNAYAGDSVTALYPHMGDAGADLTTFMGVKPGDKLTFGLRFSPSITSTLLGSMTINVPALPNSSYVAYTACAGIGFGTATSATLSEYSNCHHEPMDVMLIARDSSTNVLTQAGFISAATFQSGGTLSLTQWQPATTSKSLGVTGLLPDVTNVTMLDYDYVNSAVPYSASYGGTPSNGQYTSPVFQWPGQGTREWMRTALSRQGPWYSMFVMDNVAPTTQPYMLASPALPPWMTTNFVASAAAQMAAWFPVGNGPQSGSVLRVTWSHTTGSSSAPYTWTFIVPPGVTAINFPKLPDAVAMNAPHPEDFASVNYVRAFDIPELAGYDDVRKLPEETIVALDQATELGLLKRVISNF